MTDLCLEQPRWDVVNKLYNEFYKILTEIVNDERPTFIEIDTCLMMLNNSMQEAKLNFTLKSLEKEQKATMPSGLYQ
jgi:hypothetical protein|tara:strand:+ start:573 stop:803 length:231 start_codon:yes stop_codon:yes gene_type:complete